MGNVWKFLNNPVGKLGKLLKAFYLNHHHDVEPAVNRVSQLHTLQASRTLDGGYNLLRGSRLGRNQNIRSQNFHQQKNKSVQQ